MDVSRKRAAVACQLCRRRKRRCNGERPTCGLCSDAGVDCSYAETTTQRSESTQDSLTNTLSSRLDGIEALLQQHSRALSDLPTQPSQSQRHNQQTQQVSVHSSTHESPQTSGGGANALALEHASPAVLFQPQSAATSPTIFLDICNNVPQMPITGIESVHGSVAHYATPAQSHASPGVILPPMTIPHGHLTTTGSLLGSKQVTALLGDFPVDVFLDTEVRRSIPHALTNTTNSDIYAVLPNLDESSVGHLMDAFLALVHPENPIVEEAIIVGIYKSALQDGLRQDLDGVLCLVCFALGEAVQRMPTPAELADTNWAPGAEYVSLALPILIQEFVTSFGSNILLPQALYLVARYFGYLARPLQSWRYVHMASTNLQHFSNSLRTMTPLQEGSQDMQAILRAAWAIFGLECDLIAEHHFPRSGIEHIVDSLPLPQCGPSPRIEMLYWLSELSVRRLLNRVHHVLYMNETDPSALQPQASNHLYEAPSPSFQALGTLLKVSAELERQLETWFDLLPTVIKPDLTDSSAWDMNRINILCRYYSAKDIIFRPFVMYVCKLPLGSDVPSGILERCQKCLDSCQMYLDLSERRIQTPCSFGEIIIHSTFASAIILTVASLCPLLKDCIADVNGTQNSATNTIQRLAFEGSCIESMLWILTAMQVKAKMTRRVNEAPRR